MTERVVRTNFLLVASFVMLSGPMLSHADEHKHHEHGEKKAADVKRPVVFLDKSSRIVWYQLNRLDNARLLLVERATTDAKYAPVHAAILTRAGMSRQDRGEALQALVTLNKSSAVIELLAGLERVDAEDRQEQRNGQLLIGMLLRQPMASLNGAAGELVSATSSENSFVRQAGFAALVTAGKADEAWKAANADEVQTLDYLAAVALVPKADNRAALRASVIESMSVDKSKDVRNAAITALASIPNEHAKNFDLAAPFASDPKFKSAAVRTMLSIPKADRSAATSKSLVDTLVKQAEATPAAQRTTDDFIDAMQLADQLLAKLPTETSREYRARMREISVRVVRIHTVEEEMRYDIPYFAVEAGRPVQIVLKNEDLMPHNLVVTIPGALKEVAEIAAKMSPQDLTDGKEYIPRNGKVLFATGMVQSRQQERLTFDAPTEPGEYPFVCTFPRHWMRMYGVMVVVPDLDAWQKNPVKPKDPIGSNREFVQKWTVEDLAAELETGLRGRSFDIGQRIFKEATCLSCHQVHGDGGKVGPDLTEVTKRWKGDRIAVLREILDPSHRIDPKFAVNVIVDFDGKVTSGIISEETKETISVITNPEAPMPKVIEKDNIDEMVKSSKSMMPKALLDRFTKDEIFELLYFIEESGKRKVGKSSR